jgi:hypothetical protein
MTEPLSARKVMKYPRRPGDRRAEREAYLIVCLAIRGENLIIAQKNGVGLTHQGVPPMASVIDC